MNNVIFNDEMNDKILSGITKLYEAVSCTLGPSGRNVIISKDNGKPFITNDGVTIASSIELDDEIENIGASLIKEAAKKTNDTVGDGTTTTIVLTYELYRKGLELIKSGVNNITLAHEIERYKKEILKELKNRKRNCNTKNKIKQVSMIASKSEEIGNVISNVFNEIGFDNYIIVEDKVIDKCTYETINGMKLDFGYHIEGSIGENITKLNVYNAYVYTLEYISNINDLEMFMNNNKDIVIFCDDYENEILNDVHIIKKAKAIDGLKVNYRQHFNISGKDREIMYRIVEAEAGGENINGRMLVANVILNRCLNDSFPDTVKDVVFEKSQFSPVSAGKYGK